MSGVGSRFQATGRYKDPKPLIVVDGKPIIEHIVEMFPEEEDFIFICNEEHLRSTSMKSVLERIAKKGKIIPIAPHKKGPVYAVSQILDELPNNEEVIVNYCDFSCYWNYNDFLDHTRKRNADGAVPAYRGFHPHMLGPTNYAFMKVTPDQWMLEIKEKEPFTDNRMEEFASSGTYYFSKGSLVKKYFLEQMRRDIHLKGEYYVSLIYNLMVEDRLKVSIYELQHFLQWGTPEDLEEYKKWSDYFLWASQRHESLKPLSGTTNLVPMAGSGKRFSEVGYKEPKPLISVSGKPMVVQSVNSAPSSERQIFVCLKEHLDKYPLKDVLQKEFPKSEVLSLSHLTEGQACTCLEAKEELDMDRPLLITPCDSSVVSDIRRLKTLFDNPGVDAMIWTFRKHPSSARKPEMYGWVRHENNKAIGVSVKIPISQNPFEDHAIVGLFWFRRAGDFVRAANQLIEKNRRVNNEFYVDSVMGELIELGKNVQVFEVDHYICWGTPNDLKAFEYWQSYFHKSKNHPYSLESDGTVASEAVEELNKQYKRFVANAW